LYFSQNSRILNSNSETVGAQTVQLFPKGSSWSKGISENTHTLSTYRQTVVVFTDASHLPFHLNKDFSLHNLASFWHVASVGTNSVSSITSNVVVV
jgi:hypothetical protein